QACSAACFGRAGCFLDIELLHDAVLHQHGEAAYARAEPALGQVYVETEGAGEVAIAVGENLQLVLSAGKACPSAHHEGIVHSHDGNGVDVTRLEGIEVFHEARKVIVGAGRGECARHAEKDDLAPSKEFTRADLLSTVACNLLDFDIGHALA